MEKKGNTDYRHRANAGWADLWQSNALGSILVHDADGAPVYEGSWHVRITNMDVYLWRAVNLAGQSNLVLSLAYKSLSSQNYNRVWIDDGTPRLVLDSLTGDDTWRTMEVSLEPSEYVNGLLIKLGNEGTGKRAKLYYDKIEIKRYVAPDPIVVTLSSPLNGSATTEVNPLLSWSADNPADTYHLMLDDNSDFLSPVIDNSTLVNNNYQTADLLENTTYYWKVKGAADDIWYDWSSAGNFTTAALSVNSILIQAEDFISYVDTSPGNYDLVYRNDVDVDMNYDHDPYFYEGIRVMAIQTGEELSYTFEVPATDVWDVTFNGIINFDLYFDDSLYASNIGTPLDFRGDFRYNQDIIVSDVSLTAGTHTMKIISNSMNDFGDVQLDYIWFASTTYPPGPPPVAPKPYDDSIPPTIPLDYVSPVSQYGKLYVDGPNIKSSITGENARMRFAALSSSKWFPTIKNNTIYNLAYHENVDGIRLAMYAEYGTYDDPYLRPYLQEKTLEIINECIDAGIYLEISYHTHAVDFQIDGTAYDVEMDFYNWLLAQPVVAARPPNLIFGVINEIASSTILWNTAKPYAQAFVDLIRTTHPDNLIFVGTPYWCQRPDDVIGNTLIGNNIVYTFHMYTAQHQMTIADNIISAYDAGIPLWANELSPGHYDWTLWSYNFANFDNLINILETRGISWTNWVWSVKGEALSAFYWNSQYYGPWQASDLTEGGLYIRDKFDDPWPELSGGDIDVDTLQLTGFGPVQGTKYYGKATGSIKDENINAAGGVLVSYTWEGVVSGSGTVTTSADGSFSIDSPKVKDGGTFIFTIDSISKSGFSVDDGLYTEPWFESLTCP